MATVDELFDSLMKNCKKPDDIVGRNGLLNQLLKNPQERPTSRTLPAHQQKSQGEMP
ncbi:MAG: hypothetical protein WCP20_15415 [Desulfuromonadales bacterium]